METVNVVVVVAKKVWVECDMMGGKHVMMQHQSSVCDPFCYCSFHYGYMYTDNGIIRREAERMAIALGATDPVEFREAQWDVPNV